MPSGHLVNAAGKHYVHGTTTRIIFSLATLSDRLALSAYTAYRLESGSSDLAADALRIRPDPDRYTRAWRGHRCNGRGPSTLALTLLVAAGAVELVKILPISFSQLPLSALLVMALFLGFGFFYGLLPRRAGS